MDETDQTLIGAFDVFLRYGYRKTSLDDIAQSVGVSRQTLYQRYKNKENLFKSALEAEFEHSLSRCRDVAKNSTENIEDKLFEIMDIWCGEYITTLRASPHAAEVMEESDALVGDLCETKMEEFTEIFTRVLEDNDLPSQKDAGLSPRKVADVMHFTAKGLFYKAKDYEEFAEHIRTTILMICRL
ncbi:MAG: TetR/AcrR family transcriptional regulator [Alphaproteobacteria bacterium]